MTYKFSTIQDVLDRVPGDRIAECLTELGQVLGAAKLTAILIHETAAAIAKEDGKEVPPLPERIFEVKEIEWVDDKKGDLEARMHYGSESMSIKIVKDKKA